MDDLYDPEYDEYEHDDRTPDKPMCRECQRETAGESCGFCGNDLCPACLEMGGGFCSAVHSQEMIWAYEDQVYPPANERERFQRIRQRQAQRELKSLGILP